MALADIAAGLEVTTEQRDRGVATVDDTGTDLSDALATHADDLPCSPDAAATVVDAYGGGASVGAAGHEAGVAPMTAAKTLHRCGVDGVCPVSPQGRRVVCDWIAGLLTRSEARTLSGASDAEFALAAYVETHDPIPDAADAVERALSTRGNAAVHKRDALAETMSGATEFL